MDDGHNSAAATLAVAILEKQDDLPNGRAENLRGKAYEDRLIETYLAVLARLRQA